MTKTMKTGDRTESLRAFGLSEIDDELARPAGMSRLSVQIGVDEPVLLYATRDVALMIGQRLVFSNEVLTDADKRINDVSVRSCWTGELVGADLGRSAAPGSIPRGTARKSFCNTPGCRRRASFQLHPNSYRGLDDLDYCDSCLKDREERSAVAMMTGEAARLRQIGKTWKEAGTGIWIGGLLALCLVSGSGGGVGLALLVAVFVLSETANSIGRSYRNRALLTIRAIGTGNEYGGEYGNEYTPHGEDAGSSRSLIRKYSCGASFSPDVDSEEASAQ